MFELYGGVIAGPKDAMYNKKAKTNCSDFLFGQVIEDETIYGSIKAKWHLM